MKRVHPDDPLVIHEWREHSQTYQGFMMSLCGQMIVSASSFRSVSLPPGAVPRPCLECLAVSSKPEAT